jgi:hypothetical protein
MKSTESEDDEVKQTAIMNEPFDTCHTLWVNRPSTSAEKVRIILISDLFSFVFRGLLKRHFFVAWSHEDRKGHHIIRLVDRTRHARS